MPKDPKFFLKWKRTDKIENAKKKNNNEREC